VLLGATLVVPLVANVPLHPPLAAQDVAFVLDQLRFELSPDGMLLGLAVSNTVGAGPGGSKNIAFTIALKPAVRVTSICTWPVTFHTA
jgi:hypothetical protein